MNKGTKYALYSTTSDLRDIIIAHHWQINTTHHAFYDEDSKLLSVWPIANTIVEAVDLHNKMKKTLDNQPTSNENDKTKINQTIEKL